jgi:hypothetical protein
MNLTGAQLYSRATSGLRKGGSESPIFDQQFKLVFIYPMLFDARLQGKFSELIRSFIAVSMLKEIFVSNALNIVKLASKDHPLIDERGNPLQIGAMVNQSIASHAGISSGDNQIQIDVPRKEIDKYELQKKITEKTAIIKKYLSAEPRLKKLNSYVEIITLDNMIDVPVIVGTKDYQINTLTLAFVLAVSIALNKRLDSLGNVDFIFRTIENMKPEDAWSLFNNLTEKTQYKLSERIIDYIRPSYPRLAANFQKYAGYITAPMERFKSARGGASSFINRTVGPYIPSRGMSSRKQDPTVLRHSSVKYDSSREAFTSEEDPTKVFEPGSSKSSAPQFDILSVVKDDLSQVHLFFKFMLDDELLRTQFGLDRSQGQIKTAGTRISEHALNSLAQSLQTFHIYMARHISGPFNSIFWVFTPYDTGISFADEKEIWFDNPRNEFNVKLNKLTDDLGDALYNAFISASPDVALKRTRSVSKLCEKAGSMIFDTMNKINKKLNSAPIRSIVFDRNDVSKLAIAVDDSLTAYRSVNTTLKQFFQTTIPNAYDLIDDLYAIVGKAMKGMFNAYESRFDSLGTNNPFQNVACFYNKDSVDGKPVLSDEKKEISGFISESEHALIEIIVFHYLAAMVPAICGFIDRIEVEIETVINDALDLPNYTLVLPVETVAMLHTAIISKSWRNLVQGGNTQNTNLTDNYVKGVVKFIHQKINVPNLIVIDEKRGQIFYKLQYMSQVNKSNISTFKSYIDHLTKEELSSSQY